MRRRSNNRQPVQSQLVTLTLRVGEERLKWIDAVGETLEADRQAVLLRGFDLLLYAVNAHYSQDEYKEPAGVADLCGFVPRV